MIRAVLDLNVLVSALISPEAAPARAVGLWRARRFLLVTRRSFLIRLAAALARPRLRRYGFQQMAVARLMWSLSRYALVVPGDVVLTGVARDPEDDDVLGCAVEGAADYIVTGDNDLLSLGSYEGIPIVTPAAFIQIVEAA